MLDRILGKIGEINGLIGEMAANAEMEAGNIQQVNSSIGDMDKMTQQNAAMVEEHLRPPRAIYPERQTASLRCSRASSSRPARSGRAPRQRQSRHAVSAPRPARRPVAGNLAVQVTGEDWAEF